MNKYLVEFGFKVYAYSTDDARKNAKKNLKESGERQVVHSFKCTKLEETKMEQKLKMKTQGGIAEGAPLSDIQRYNKRLDILTNWVKGAVILGYGAFMFLVFMTLYIIWNNVLNNWIAAWA